MMKEHMIICWKDYNGQGDNFITGCLLDYPYFKKHYRMIVIELSKQHVLNANSKAIQQN